ncbi:MAG: hypothetical protein IJC48_11270 [Clostridia bacterium]|nr:hypothetical protein [Clostridia bacterium]
MLKTGAENSISRILSALRVLLVPAAPGEYDLHALVACALTNAEIEFTHEARLAPGCRADFLSGDIVIEIKKGKPQKSALLSQVKKYLACEGVSGIIVVSQKNVSLPRSIDGKIVASISLDKLWGVALP